MADNTIKKPSPEYVKLIETETKEAVESFRWLAAQLLQIATVLSIANLTVIGYATANNQAALFILGSLITLILLFAYRLGIRAAIPLLCRLFELENSLELILQKQTHTTISLLFLSVMGPSHLKAFEEINTIKLVTEKYAAMRKLERKLFYQRRGSVILMLAAIVQLALIPILVYVYQWKFL